MTDVTYTIIIIIIIIYFAHVCTVYVGRTVYVGLAQARPNNEIYRAVGKVLSNNFYITM